MPIIFQLTKMKNLVLAHGHIPELEAPLCTDKKGQKWPKTPIRPMGCGVIRYYDNPYI